MANYTIETIVNALTDAFPECEVTVAINKQDHAIVIIPDGKMGVTLYWEEIKDKSLEEIVNMIANGLQMPFTFDAEWVTNYENVKDKLMVCVGSSEYNDMKSIVHRVITGDLCEYYRIKVENFFSEPGAEASITIQHSLLESWGISEEQLREDAMMSTQKMSPMKISTMLDTVRDVACIPNELELPVWLFSNERYNYGAGVITYPDFFDEVKKTVGESCYIMPASVHEVIIATISDVFPSVEYMRDTVKKGNENAVRERVQLSDNVFYVDTDKKTITVAD